MIIVYTDGVFDLFHTGHAKLFENIKTKLFPGVDSNDIFLIVGVSNDKETHEKKGLTVMNETERYYMVKQCKFVDKVIESCPWIITKEFIDNNNIDWVTRENSPYNFGSNAKDGGDIYSYVKSINKFKHIDRTENVSSTDIISKIIKNYNHYLIRNLKRGTSSQDLNLHPFIAFALMFRYKIQSGEILIDMENKIDKISENISNTFEKKNRELISNIEEIKSYSNNIKNNLSNNIPIFSKKTFFSGLLLGSLSFYLVLPLEI